MGATSCRRFILLLAFLHLPCARLWAQETEDVGIPAHVLASFRIHGDGDAIVLPVSFNGSVYHFVLDTGATGNVFDKSFKSLLGPVRGTGGVNIPSGLPFRWTLVQLSGN